MSKLKKKTGFHKDGLDVLVWEIFRGTGRQTGRTLSKAVTEQISKRTIDSDSKFRKAMDKFEITATLKTSLNKMYKIIDLFQEEYTTTKAVLQKTWYLKQDVKLIDTKLRNIERLVFTEPEERALSRCIDFWDDIKGEILKNG